MKYSEAQQNQEARRLGFREKRLHLRSLEFAGDSASPRFRSAGRVEMAEPIDSKDPFVDRFGRLTPSGRARSEQQTAAEAAQSARPEFDLLEVVKSEPIQSAVSAALERQTTSGAAREAAFQNFQNLSNRFQAQTEADIDRNAAQTFNTQGLRDFLEAENRRFETDSQAVAGRAGQFLRQRLDEQLLGSGGPIADSSDLRNRTFQGFLDINLPLQQQLSDRRIPAVSVGFAILRCGCGC